MADPSAVTEVVLALLESESLRVSSPAEVALRTLERLRSHTGAAAAVLWTVSGTMAERLLHVGQSPPVPLTVTFGSGSMALERLRRNGAIRCSAGEVSGVEQLVPRGMRSHIAAAATRAGAVSGVLALGWTTDAPPCSDRATADLRIAAAVLGRLFAASAPAVSESSLNAVIVASLIDRIVVLDREGTVIAVNDAWTHAANLEPVFSDAPVGIGENYLDICRRFAARSTDAARACAGLATVCAGESQSFEFAYQCTAPAETQWWLMRAIPLSRPEGGVVVRYIEVTGALTTEFDRIIGSEHFRDLTDALAVPVFALDRNGVVLFSNAAWRDVTGERAALGVPWTDACHHEDRADVLAEMGATLPHGHGFDVEVRLLSGDGTYRWWQISVSPLPRPDGHTGSFLATCRDVTPDRHTNQALQDAGARLIASQEAVRSRIARELHDDIGQQVIMLTTRLDTLMNTEKLPAKQVRDVLKQTQDGLQELARGVHNLSHELHPAKLRLLGLKRTVAALARDMGTDSGVNVAFEMHGFIGEIPEDRALCIFRIAQEAVQNAVKHSGARTVDVTLTGTPTNVTLKVTDDGSGFDSLSLSTGLGLLTMRERVELIGGTLRIHTAPSSGTTIEATVPVAADTADQS